MKNIVYVLDQYTNGHEAALNLIKKNDPTVDRFEIVFCGTHDEVIRKLSKGPSYAVLPVHNTILGEISSVTDKITELTELGHEFICIDKFELPIKHCLMVKNHVNSVGEITSVISKSEALLQCGNFLRVHGISLENQICFNSTGKSAIVVSNMKSDSTIAAIAPRIAAEALGLKVLSDDIQDEKENVTTFHFLKNLSKFDVQKIRIIGTSRQVGQSLKLKLHLF